MIGVQLLEIQTMKKKPKKKYAKPIFLYPLTPDQALYAFMNVNPKKIKIRERKAKKNR